jgi:NAD(P)-dependent dehydrogenase (short-subunit alcohol dehydrogenase family)
MPDGVGRTSDRVRSRARCAAHLAIPSVDGMADNIALITGASRGFGRALARALARDGWKLIVDARDGHPLDALARELGPAVHTVPGDISDPAHRADLAAAVDRLGGLDLLVNNASTLGATPLPWLADLPADALTRVFAVNTVAPLALTRLLLPTLRERGGAVVNVTSDAAVEAYEGWAGYGASKAALEQASRILAAEEPRVRVWWFDPGDMRTRMHAEAFPGEDISDRPEPETVVPALQRLITERPASGRYRSADLVASS